MPPTKLFALGAALLLSLLAPACASHQASADGPRAAPAKTAGGTAAPASHEDDPAPPVQSAPKSPHAARVLAALRAASPAARRVVVSGPLEPDVASALRGAAIQVVERDGEASLVHVVDADGARAWLDANGHQTSAVLFWTDVARVHRSLPDRVHVVTRLEATGGAEPRFEHMLVASDDKVFTRLVAEGLLPSAPGIEIVETLADGTREVRVLGYVNPYAAEPERQISVAAEGYSAVRLSTAPEIATALRVAARSGRGKLVGPAGAMLEEDRERTLIPAVGTCGQRTWVTSVVVVLRGKLRAPSADDGGIVLEVERVEDALPLARWQAVAPRVASALESARRSVSKQRALVPEAAEAVARARAEVQRAFGPAATLLELDGVLAALHAAFARGSTEAARAALELRCRTTSGERALEDALRAATR